MPPFAQQFEPLRRKHHVAIPLPLALLDPQRHALAVDIEHLQVRDLGHAQARAEGVVSAADAVGLEQSGKLRCRSVGIERRLNFPRGVENDHVAQTVGDRQCHRVASAARGIDDRRLADTRALFEHARSLDPDDVPAMVVRSTVKRAGCGTERRANRC